MPTKIKPRKPRNAGAKIYGKMAGGKVKKETLDQAIHMYNKGKYRKAENLYRQILMQSPKFHPAHHNLALVYVQMEKLDKAVECLREAVEICPDKDRYHYNLGYALFRDKKPEEAADAYYKTISLNPEYAEAYAGLGQLHKEKSDIEVAVNWYKEAIRAGIDKMYGYRCIAACYRDAGMKIEAIEWYEKILEVSPGDAEAQHILASYKGVDTETAPEKYVSGLFNNYADKFEDHLVGGLRYHVPEYLIKAVKKVAGAETASWKMVDLGCGTGLCGPLFRNLASHMTGIDLAPNMLEIAREKDVYDNLKNMDLAKALMEEEDASLDLAISTDVFIYVGDLEEVFCECARTLREGGMLAFSAESYAGNEFILRSSGRYAHSTSYIKRLSAKFGFSEVLREEIIVRFENGKPLAGHIYVLKRGTASESFEDNGIEINAENLGESLRQALAHHMAGHHQRAEAAYRTILEYEPKHAETLHFLGVLMNETGHTGEAIRCFEQTIEIDPKTPAYHTNLGLALHAQGDSAAAIEHLKKAISLDPLNVETMNNLAILLNVQGDKEESILYFQRILKIQPKFAEARNNLGAMLLDTGKLEEAEEQFRAAVNLAPEYLDARRNYGKLFRMKESWKEAAECYEYILRFQPEDPQATEMKTLCEEKFAG